MRNSLVVCFLIFLMCGCTTPQVSAEEYINCTHKYDASLDILVKKQGDIQIIEIENCPEILINSEKECPNKIKITTLKGEIIWLTEEEFENYVCKKVENK